MSSVRLSDLHRTTSFRLALLFVALFGAASLMLFGFLYWRTAGYLSAETDDWLAREQAALARTAPGELAARLDDHGISDPGLQRPFAWFDASGNRIAGELTTLPSPFPPMDRPFEFMLKQGERNVSFRGLAHRLPAGGIILVSQNVHEMNEFSERLVGAMAWGGLLVLLMALGGAALTGIGALRRIDGVTRAIERIVGGDLAERLPTRGPGGDLDRLVHVVNSMLDDLERLMHEVKGVCDGIAHDLRTPLTRLLAGLERARRRAMSADDYATAVDEAIAEMQGILSTFSALLRISEVEDGARRGGFTVLDLAKVAADVTEFYDPLAEGKDIALSLESTGPVEISGDPSLLFEAISNLVDNAIKFTASGGRVAVRTFCGNEGLGVIVADTGPGIPAEERDAVLRRFHRAEKSRHTPGTGLGLSLVAAISRLHGFRLEIEDAGPGCRVTLWRDGGPGEPAPSARQHLADVERKVVHPEKLAAAEIVSLKP
ncbi:MAG: cusS 3 [Rhodospirillales bacterium]|nr:cusS 3 [Rhodospirillales bacterium]